MQGWAILWSVYLPLLGYKHVNGPDGATLVPYLAQALPTVFSDGLTYTMTLRKGLKYSDGTPVKASDFPAWLKRDYKVDSPGVGFFGNIVGTDTIAKTKKGHISGITADDATGTITIKLKSPQGDFEYILATEFAALVPASSPGEGHVDDARCPSTGPYMIQSYKPNKQVDRRSEPELRRQHVRRQRAGGQPGQDDDRHRRRRRASRCTQTLQRPGRLRLPPDLRPTGWPSCRASTRDQIKVYTPANTYYFFMKACVAPFDNVKVRQAVNYAINREALVRINGGLATPTQNILPPTYPQYKKLKPVPVQRRQGESCSSRLPARRGLR